MKWISVKKRLPEFGIWVLGYYQFRSRDAKGNEIGEILKCFEIVQLSSIEHKKDSKDPCFLDRNWDKEQISHWQPLPPPPENLTNE